MATGRTEQRGTVSEEHRAPRRAGAGGATPGVRRALRVGLALVLAVKLLLVGLWSQGMLGGAAAAAGAPATGVEPPAAHRAPPATVIATAGTNEARPDAANAKPSEVRGLLAAVTRRQAELDARERELTTRAERLQVFEKDVTAKITSLEEIERRLQARAKAATAAVGAAAESLAKVYGAMKPTDAAPILERLDEPTVLTIFTRMKEKQIGEILPLMSRDKAIALTRALAERR